MPKKQTAIPDDIFALLRCPACGGPLEQAPGKVRCIAEKREWPVVDGVPHLIPERELRR